MVDPIVPAADSLALLSTIAAVATAVVGALAWRFSVRMGNLESRTRAESDNADLERAEHEGWALLLSNLRDQYEASVKERGALLEILASTRSELSSTRQELERTRHELEQMRRHVVALERRLDAQ